MEDAKTYYDSTVRGANRNIIQFVYGDDSMDPTKLERTVLNIFGMNNLEIEQHYRFTADENWELLVNPKVIKEIKSNKEILSTNE